eukprot:m.66084 g.66084  ORF g.66084 m.66084 type:complete len:280 (+) comp12097_c0_seq1:691-1530(+)
MFGWLDSSLTVYNGTRTVNGVKCDEWSLTVPAATVGLCTAKSTIVQYSVIDRVQHLQTSYDFFNFNPVKPDPSKMIRPAYCNDPPRICPGPETVADLDMYIFHPKNTTGTIWDQDTADVLGDTIFVCADAMSNHTTTDHYEYISHYRVRVIEKWGEYAQCNGYPGVCLGPDLPHVGREASMGAKHLGGQCQNNTDLGNWYSLRKMGMCPLGQPMSVASNCTWQIIERVKTIDAHCVLHERGMLADCLAEVHVPLTNAKRTFELAFASDDEAQGGCPSVV